MYASHLHELFSSRIMPSFPNMLALFNWQLDRKMSTGLKFQAVEVGDPGMVTLKDLMEPILEGGP